MYSVEIKPSSDSAENNFLVQSYPMDDRNRRIVNYLRSKELLDSSILLCGHPKSGNTWVRFVIFNYFNILVNGSDETLSYSELNALQSHKAGSDAEENFKPFKLGFPPMFHTHGYYHDVFKYFGKIIYIYRNPMDTMVSWYHFMKNRTVPFGTTSPAQLERLSKIENFVLDNTVKWVSHILLTLPKSDVVLNYDQMVVSPHDWFELLFRKVFIKYDPIVLHKAIDMSSKSKIKQMANLTGQHHGMGAKGIFLGDFVNPP